MRFWLGKGKLLPSHGIFLIQIRYFIIRNPTFPVKRSPFIGHDKRINKPTILFLTSVLGYSKLVSKSFASLRDLGGSGFVLLYSGSMASFLLYLLFYRLVSGIHVCIPKKPPPGQPGVHPRPLSSSLRFWRHTHAAGCRTISGQSFPYVFFRNDLRHGLGICHRSLHGISI